MAVVLVINSHRELLKSAEAHRIMQKMIRCRLRDAGEDKMTVLIWKPKISMTSKLTLSRSTIKLWSVYLQPLV